MNRLILLVESRIRGDVYVRFGGELPKTHRSNTAGRWMLSLPYNNGRALGEYNIDAELAKKAEAGDIDAINTLEERKNLRVELDLRKQLFGV